MTLPMQRPTPAFIGASWIALCIGILTYLVGHLECGDIA